MTENVRLDEVAMLRSLVERLIGEGTVSKADRDKEQRMLRQRIRKLDAMTESLYEDRVTGVLSEDTYTKLARENEAERLENEKRLALLETSEQERAAKLADIQLWLRLMRESADFTEVTRDLLDSVVERIEVGEREVVDGVKHQDIRVIYRFIGSGINDFHR